MQLAELICSPFVFIFDPIALRTTTAAVKTALDSPNVFHVHVDAVAAFTQRLLFAAILGADSHCDSWDSFLHGLQLLHAQKNAPIVITIEQVYRLKERLPDAIVPLTRLAELSQLNLTVVFLSQTQWQDIKPPLGASPEPYYIDPKPLSKPEIIQTLSARYPLFSGSDSYDPSLEQLYSHYIAMVCEVCFPYTHDIDELAYIAAARWPGFVKPILSSSSPPSEDTRLRLLRTFTPTLTSALESLHPRLMNAADWAAANDPDPNILLQPLQSSGSQQPQIGLSSLPRMSKFILVASYIASTNPAKTDVRMFGRGLDEKKRRRRVARVQAKARQIPPHLLGPSPFPVDRMIAILGALLEENDVDSRLPHPEFTIQGEYTDMEISRVVIYNAIMELVSMHLLLRTSPPDRINGPPTFKSAISQDTALLLAKQLQIPLNDLLWI